MYWEPGTQYNYDDVVEYEGHRYKIIQPHRSQSDWTPPVTPALWGRLQDGDHHGHEKRHEGDSHPQQEHHQQSGYEGNQPQQPPQQTTHVTEDERKTSWHDIDDKRKHELEIGGGLLAGAAAIGAGYFAFKEHEKSEEEKKAQTWALSNWLREAEARTEDFRRNGPRGPANWVLNRGKNIPQGAIVAGEEHGKPLYACRGFHDGGIQLGKAAEGMKKGGVIGYKNDEIDLDVYEILLGDMNALRWVNASGRLNVASLGARPIEGGRENDGSPLYVVQAPHHGATHPGKASEKLDGAYIPYDGKEKKVSEYRVLCYA